MNWAFVAAAVVAFPLLVLVAERWSIVAAGVLVLAGAAAATLLT